MIGFIFRTVFATAAATLVATASLAAPVYFFGSDLVPNGSVPAGGNAVTARNSFVNNVTALQTETVETAGTGSLALNQPVPIFAGGGRLTQPTVLGPNLSGGRISVDSTAGTSSSGRFNTTNGGGTGQYFESDAPFSITLNSNVSAFGFYSTDFGDFQGTLQIELFDGNDLKLSNAFTTSNGAAPSTGSTTGSLLFFGFIADNFSFNRLVFTIRQTNISPDSFDTIGFDDILIGQRIDGGGGGSVPEPASLALVATSLGVLIMVRRRRPV